MGPPENAWELIQRKPGPFVSWTLVIGFGVMTGFCGIGILLMWWGAARLLSHAAETAGSATPTKMQATYAGLWAVGLAAAIAMASFVAPVALGPNGLASTLGGVLGVLLVGAILAPLAYAPFAAATGTDGLFQPVWRGIDLAGADRFGRLAPLCALVAALVYLPVPGVLLALGGAVSDSPAWIAVALGTFAVWMLAVPWSAATLTLRVVELERSARKPTGVGQAARPVIGALVVGAASVLAAVVVQAARPQLVRPGRPDPASIMHETTRPLSRGYGPDAFHDVPGTDLRLRMEPHGQSISVDSPAAEERWHSLREPMPGDCRVSRRRAGGLVVVCEDDGDAIHVQLDVLGDPQPPPLLGRVHLRSVSGGAMALALLLVGFVLFSIGRLGRAVRLMVSKPFTYAGTVNDDALVFLTRDGAHRVRVPREQLDRTFDGFIGNREPAVLVSPEGLPPIGLRTAETACPPHALLVIGTLEDAIAKHVTRARKLGFRVGVASLALLVVAAVALIAHV